MGSDLYGALFVAWISGVMGGAMLVHALTKEAHTDATFSVSGFCVATAIFAVLGVRRVVKRLQQENVQ
jgi:hypothetical protein